MNKIMLALSALLLSACNQTTSAASATSAGSEPTAAAADKATAVFAGGCFWCVESDFEKLNGVAFVISGYSGGVTENPTYREVASEKTGHREAVEVHYDPAVVSYETLVDYFFRHIDPTDDGGQFCDRGESYTTAIFVKSPEERAAAEAGKSAAASAIGATIVTDILELAVFWPAEEYHQDYYKKNKTRYSLYRSSCGRDARVKEVWSAAK